MKDGLKSLSPVAGSAVNTALECCNLLCLVLKNVNGFVNRLLIDRKSVCTLILHLFTTLLYSNNPCG